MYIIPTHFVNKTTKRLMCTSTRVTCIDVCIAVDGVCGQKKMSLKLPFFVVEKLIRKSFDK